MGHLLFTSDFHELVRGTLKAGSSCRINFDPRRFTQKIGTYVHGEIGTEINAHCLFLPSGEQITLNLVSETGILLNAVESMTGTGSMLSGYLNIPNNVSEMEIWFTLVDKEGKVYYDSKDGANYHFRFSLVDIISNEVKVVIQPDKAVSNLKADFTTITDVESISIRYRLLNSTEAYVEKELILHIQESADKKLWTAEEAIPFGAVVGYNYVYVANGKSHKEDNNGNYFLAH